MSGAWGRGVSRRCREIAERASVVSVARTRSRRIACPDDDRKARKAAGLAKSAEGHGATETIETLNRARRHQPENRAIEV
jgi:hypothetical protein